MFIEGNFLFLLVLLQTFIMNTWVALSHEGLPQHPQKSYCENPYVMNVTLVYKNDSGYGVTVDQIYKGNVSNLQPPNGTFRFSMEPNCSDGLPVGATWIFFGNTSETGELFSATCIDDRLWRWLVASRVSRHAHSYEKGCRCKGSDILMEQTFCGWLHSFFQFENGRCVVVKTDAFQRCIRRMTYPKKRPAIKFRI